MIKKLTDSSRKIKSISNSRTGSMLDMYNKGKGYFIASDWKDEVIANYNFYITIIGFIEAYIIDVANKLKKEKDYKKTEKLIQKLEVLIKKREKIVDIYLENNIQNDLPIVKEIMKSKFIYTELNRIYSDLEVGNNKYQLHQSFVEAYNFGSKLANNCDYKKIILIFNKLWLEIRKTKTLNEQKIYQTGNEQTLKKMIIHKNNIAKNREQ